MTKRSEGWSRETVLLAIQGWIDSHDGRFPRQQDFRGDPNLPSDATVEKYVGRVQKVRTALNYKPAAHQNFRQYWDRDSILEAYWRWITEHDGQTLNTHDFKASEGLPSWPTVQNYWATHDQLYAELKRLHPNDSLPDHNFRKFWSRDSILEACVRWIDEHGCIPHANDFETSQKLPFLGTIKKHFDPLGRLHDELRRQRPDAPDHNFRKFWSRDSILEACVRWIDEHGCIPNTTDFERDETLPSWKSSTKHWSSFPLLQEELKRLHPDVPMSQHYVRELWTRQSVLEACARWIDEHGCIPNTVDCDRDETLPHSGTVVKHFDSVKPLYEELKLRYPNVPMSQHYVRELWSQDSILRTCTRWIDEHGCIPNTNDFKTSEGLPGSTTVLKHFGSFEPLYEELKLRYPNVPDHNFQKSWNRKSILDAYRQWIVQHDGRVPNVTNFKSSEGLPSWPTVQKYWTTHDQLHAELKRLHPNDSLPDHQFQKSWNQESILEACARWIDGHDGRIPSTADFERDKGLPSGPTVKKYWTSIPRLRAELKRQHPDASTSRHYARELWNQESILEACARWIDEHDQRIPNTIDCDRDESLPSSGTVLKHFVSYGRLYEELQRLHPDASLPHNFQKSWSRSSILEACARWIDEHDQCIPNVDDFKSREGLPSSPTVLKYFDSFEPLFEELKRLHPDASMPDRRFQKSWNQELILEACARWIDEYGYIPNTTDCDEDENLPSGPTVKKYWTSIPRLHAELRRQRPDTPVSRRVTRELWNRDLILEACARWIDEHDQCIPNVDDFKSREGLPSSPTVLKYFDSFEPLFEELKRLHPDASMPDHHFQKSWNRDLILEACARWIDEYGYIPNSSDFKSSEGLPSSPTVLKYFDSFEPLFEELKRLHPDASMPDRRFQKSWNQELILEACARWIDRHDQCIPNIDDLKLSEGLPYLSTVKRHFGTYRMLHAELQRRHPNASLPDHQFYKSWSRGSILEACARWIDRHDQRIPNVDDFKSSEGLPSLSTVLKYFDSYALLYGELQRLHPDGSMPDHQFYKSWSRSSILEACTRWIDEHDGWIPITDDFRRDENLPELETVRRYWGSYPLLQARLKHQHADAPRGRALSKLDVLRVIQIWMNTHDGEFPQPLDFSNDPDLPHLGIVKNRFDNLYELRARLQSGRIWNQELILQACSRWIATYQRIPKTIDFDQDRSLPSGQAVRDHWGYSALREELERRYPDITEAKPWSRTETLRVVQMWTNEHDGRFPHSTEFLDDPDLPDLRIIKNRFDNFYELRSQLRIQKFWNQELILQACSRWIATYQRIPKTIDFDQDRSLPSWRTVRNHWGYSALREELERRYPDSTEARHSNTPKVSVKKDPARLWSRGNVLAAIQGWIDSHDGRFPRQQDFQEDLDLPSPPTVYRYVGNMPEVRTALDYKPASHHSIRQSWDRGSILEVCLQWITEHDQRIPDTNDFKREKRLPAWGTIEAHWVSYQTLRDELERRVYPDIPKWNRETIHQAFLKFCEIRGYVPHTPDLPLRAHDITNPPLPTYGVLQRHWGTLTFLQQEMPLANSGWTKESAIAAAQEHMSSNDGRPPKREELYSYYGLPSHQFVVKHFGSYQGFLDVLIEPKSVDALRQIWIEAGVVWMKMHPRETLGVASLGSANELPSPYAVYVYFGTVEHYRELAEQQHGPSGRLERTKRGAITAGLKYMARNDGQLPKRRNLSNQFDLPTIEFVVRYFGSYQEFLDSLIASKSVDALRKIWIEAGADWMEAHPGTPLGAENLSSANELPSSHAIYTYFGSMSRYNEQILKALNQRENNPSDPTSSSEDISASTTPSPQFLLDYRELITRRNMIVSSIHMWQLHHNGRLPRNNDMDVDPYLFDLEYVKTVFVGTRDLHQAINASSPLLRERYLLTEMTRTWKAQHNRFPIIADFVYGQGLPPLERVILRFGALTSLHCSLAQDEELLMPWRRTTILAAIDAWSRTHGRPPTAEDIKTGSGLPQLGDILSLFSKDFELEQLNMEIRARHNGLLGPYPKPGLIQKGKVWLRSTNSVPNTSALIHDSRLPSSTDVHRAGGMAKYRRHVLNNKRVLQDSEWESNPLWMIDRARKYISQHPEIQFTLSRIDDYPAFPGYSAKAKTFGSQFVLWHALGFSEKAIAAREEFIRTISAWSIMHEGQIPHYSDFGKNGLPSIHAISAYGQHELERSLGTARPRSREFWTRERVQALGRVWVYEHKQLPRYRDLHPENSEQRQPLAPDYKALLRTHDGDIRIFNVEIADALLDPYSVLRATLRNPTGALPVDIDTLHRMPPDLLNALPGLLNVTSEKIPYAAPMITGDLALWLQGVDVLPTTIDLLLPQPIEERLTSIEAVIQAFHGDTEWGQLTMQLTPSNGLRLFLLMPNGEKVTMPLRPSITPVRVPSAIIDRPSTNNKYRNERIHIHYGPDIAARILADVTRLEGRQQQQAIRTLERCLDVLPDQSIVKYFRWIESIDADSPEPGQGCLPQGARGQALRSFLQSPQGSRRREQRLEIHDLLTSLAIKPETPRETTIAVAERAIGYFRAEGPIEMS